MPDRQGKPISVNMEAVMPHLTTHLRGARHLNKPTDDFLPIQERRWTIGMIKMPDMELERPLASAPPTGAANGMIHASRHNARKRSKDAPDHNL